MVKDQNHLIQFISKCDNLYELELKNTSVNQLFFNELASNCSLIKLSIDEIEERAFDFNFVLKMFNLEIFQTNQELSLEKAIKIIKLKKLDFVTFRLSEMPVSIRRIKKDEYEFYNAIQIGIPNEKFHLDKTVELLIYLKNRGKTIITRQTIKRLKSK